MDQDLIAVEIGPTTAAHHGWTGYIFVISTQLSALPAGAPVRTVQLTLRLPAAGPAVTSTAPITGDCFEGVAQCGLAHVGNLLPLDLAGGSAEMAAYQVQSPPPPPKPPAPPPTGYVFEPCSISGGVCFADWHSCSPAAACIAKAAANCTAMGVACGSFSRYAPTGWVQFLIWMQRSTRWRTPDGTRGERMRRRPSKGARARGRWKAGGGASSSERPDPRAQA